MGLFDSIKNLATKANELAAERKDVIGGGLDKVGDLVAEQFGDSQYIAEGIEAAKVVEPKSQATAQTLLPAHMR